MGCEQICGDTGPCCDGLVCIGGGLGSGTYVSERFPPERYD